MNSVRMCVICRGRFYQRDLRRFQVAEGRVRAYAGAGRSFYICEACLEKFDEIKFKKALKNLKANFDENSKEIFLNG